MASAIIHLAIAKEIGKRFDKNSKDYYLGSIAPDISKLVGSNKIITHFQSNSLKPEVPFLEDFLKLYKDDLKNDFTFGYFVHLFSDKLWFDGFIDELTEGESVKLIDGTIITLPEEELMKVIYDDYTNLNISLIDAYSLDLSLFYEEFDTPNTKIKEIPINKLNILVDQMGIIIKNSKEEKKYIFNMHMVNKFIYNCVNELYDYINDNDLLKF